MRRGSPQLSIFPGGAGSGSPPEPAARGLRIERIVSGGQTGADRAGLDAALRLGLPCGGWCPKDRRAEDGPIPARYPLQETRSSRYLDRTRRNVRDSDGTAVFSLGSVLSGGSLQTARYAQARGVPCLHLARDGGDPDPAGRLRAFLEEHGIRCLNVAGSRESREPGIHSWVESLLLEALGGAVQAPHPT